MQKPLTQAALAKALGLAPSRITAMKAQGMPTHSIDAARQWRARVRFYMKPAVFEDGPRPEPSVYLDGLDDGWRGAYEALRSFTVRCGLVDRFGPALAAIVDAMPIEALEQVPADLAIDDAWDALEAEYSLLTTAILSGSATAAG